MAPEVQYDQWAGFIWMRATPVVVNAAPYEEKPNGQTYRPL